MRIAFIVQPDWLKEHFGVRNLFVSCLKILEQNGHDVDFVTFGQHMNSILFYSNIVSDEDLKSNIKRTVVGTKQKYKNLTSKTKIIPEIYTQFLGTDIKNDYDAFVITNPWLLNYPLDFGNKPTALICHDCGANSLYIQNKLRHPEWGFAHNVGYQFALKNNIHFLSNSEKTDKEIIDFYNPQKHSYLPPVPTYAFLNIDYQETQKKENAIILAAPFDPRKGLAIMPDILNALKDNFDILYIFGTPRCGKKLYNKFYKEIKIKKIIHYDEITSDDLINLYKKSKMLFFPSREEGLGLPLIEAQLCGCRVVTTDDEPMNKLLCNGGYLMTKNMDTDIENMRKMLKETNFDYKNLSIDAKEKFSTENIYKELMNTLKNEGK